MLATARPSCFVYVMTKNTLSLVAKLLKVIALSKQFQSFQSSKHHISLSHLHVYTWIKIDVDCSSLTKCAQNWRQLRKNDAFYVAVLLDDIFYV